MSLRKPLIAGMLILAVLCFLVPGATARSARSTASLTSPQSGQDGRPFAAYLRTRIARALALHDELALSDEQRRDIRQTLLAHRQELVPLLRTVVDHGDNLREAVLAEHADKASIRAAAEALGEAIGDLAVRLSAVAGEIRPLLTPEQQETLRKNRMERRAALDEFLDRVSGE